MVYSTPVGFCLHLLWFEEYLSETSRQGAGAFFWWQINLLVLAQSLVNLLHHLHLLHLLHLLHVLCPLNLPRLLRLLLLFPLLYVLHLLHLLHPLSLLVVAVSQDDPVRSVYTGVAARI